VLVNGRNFQLYWRDTIGRPFVKRAGFYTTVHVRARNPEEAEFRAVNVLRRDTALRRSVANSASDPPRMFVKKIQELRSFSNRRLPRTGFAFYPERSYRASRKA
jgi:hypothetical protein